jgi:hypothetical protein
VIPEPAKGRASRAPRLDDFSPCHTHWPQLTDVWRKATSPARGFRRLTSDRQRDAILLPAANWAYQRRAHLPHAGTAVLRQDPDQRAPRGTLVLHGARSHRCRLAKSESLTLKNVGPTATMASTNKCLARSNKSRTGGKATNKWPAARRNCDWMRATSMSRSKSAARMRLPERV